jgi:plasmid stability protein
VITAQRAKDRPGYAIDLDKIKFNASRAVFPLDLLYQVAETLHNRSFEQPDDGIRQETRPYALAHILYCFHCDELAKKLENPKLRTRLGSIGAPREPHYRHRDGRKCGCEARSVLAAAVEGEVGRLLKLLAVNPDAIQQLADLAAQMQGKEDRLDLEKEKKFAIARCRTILERAKKLYLQAELSDEEYQRIREENEREMLRWETRTQDISRMYLQMEKCAVMVESFNHVWDNGTDQERYEFVHSLFDEIVVDLDTRRITSFKMKPWAEQFLVVRASLYEIDKRKNQAENGTGSTFQGSDTAMPLQGLSTISFLNSTVGAVSWLWSSVSGCCVGVMLSPFVSSGSSYSDARKMRYRSAQGLSLKSTMRCISRS